ncbi:uncharacterized protein H6S33_005208 [Morchella sextelata]|uniref:uncharacterized protein n=1 Tax=Morchella sextelata TaxID=1174677 RepID=UPI001D04719B|nr:uncharacterized protein H6S33_005208 [Morchella sextelata]KAH0605226.1 hypothetical protein H6S33_005208 [Morchella sextelata]
MDVKGKDTGISEEDAARMAALASYVPDTDEEKRLVRKIDFYLMPMLWIMYIMNYIDRTNIGNARIAGMGDDLSLDDQEYAWVLSIFFFGYLLCEVPSNMILSRSQPSIFLPGIMLVWGALSAVMAVSHTYGALLGFRFILGCIESGFFPGVLYLLSCWYKKGELGKRFAIFYSAAILSGAFGGIFAGAITGHLDNVHGIHGWRWLFIIEGAATVGISCIAFFVLLDFPATTKKFTEAERNLAVIRLLHDGMDSGRTVKRMSHKEALMSAVVDWRTWVFTFLFMMVAGSGTISYFIPTLTKSLGYDTVTAQYMTVPIYAVATVSCNVLAYSADRFAERRWHVTVALFVGFISCVLTATIPSNTVRYVMICFTASGIWSALPLLLAWTSNTVELPAEKRAVVLAIVNACGNFSSVYGSRIWPSWNAPSYSVGFGCTASFLGAGTVLAALMPILLAKWRYKMTETERGIVEAREDREEQLENAGENSRTV